MFVPRKEQTRMLEMLEQGQRTNLQKMYIDTNKFRYILSRGREGVMGMSGEKVMQC